jgi:DNA (cytosine-5)-methyltransferase 1
MNHVDLPTFRVLSLCTGAGGLDLGLSLAVPAARTVCCVEHEAYACAVLAHRMEEEALDACPIWTDLRTFDGRPWRGVVDCVTGGYPCQPFSVAGRKQGEDDPRHLWPHVARILREVRPAFAFLENVSNHLNIGYRDVRRELEESGYRVKEGLFTAEEVGATHRRERLFILAHSRCERGGEVRPAPGPDQLIPLVHNQRCGEKVGHAEDLGHERSGEPWRWRSGPADAGPAGGVAPRSGSPQPLGVRRDYGPEQPAAFGTGGLSLFPPGPDDRHGWETALRSDPTLEPAVRRVADGMAERVGRLRLCGNGVVPLAAAYAFRTLAADLLRDDGA